MKKTTFITLCALLFLQFEAAFAQNLKLITINQLKCKTAFELSGMVASPFGVMAIEDGVPHLFQIDTTNFQVEIYKQYPIPDGQTETDLEGIDFYQGKLVIVDESSSKIHFLTEDKWVNIPYELSPEVFQQKYDFSVWGNAGYEGLAFDSLTHHLFLAKERLSPDGVDRMIYDIDMETGKLIGMYSTQKHSDNPDYADIKVDHKNGKTFLYILERNDYLITRVDLQTSEVKAYSFAGYMNNNKKELILYKSHNKRYGIAEALMLTSSQIWVGLDNNNYPIKKRHPMAKKFKLKGRAPAILIFERPDDF